MRHLFLCLTLLAAAAGLLPPAAAAEPAPADRNAAAEAFSLQLVPFRDKAEAEFWRKDMTLRGYRPYLYQGRDDQGQTWYAVRIADYPTAGAAHQGLAAFKRSENMAAFVTPRDTIFPAADKNAADAAAPAPAPSAAAPQHGADLNALQAQVQALQQRMADLEKEAEARKMLRITEAEEKERESEILTAAGREYTLIPESNLGFEYGLYYDYFSSDILQDLRNAEGSRLSVERRGNHTLTNQLFTEYGLLDNLSLNFSLPFVYKYDKRSGEDDLSVTDLGDIGLGLQFQPFKAGTQWPAVIVVLNGVFPTGRSPYKINPDSELATGNGYYAAGGGLTFSKTLDPVVAYGGVNYIHPFETSDTDQRTSGLVLTEVAAGDSFGVSLGMGFALSYRTSLNLSYQYAYHFESRYHFTDGTAFDSNSWVTSSFNIGAGWRLSPRFSLYTKVDIGLTNDDPDFTFALRIPVRFDLGD